MTLVVDANVAHWACVDAARFEQLGDELVAPPLLWSEVISSLHEAVWRREVSNPAADAVRSALRRSPIQRRTHSRLHDKAWRIAEELGWAKTYDAEYLALADLLTTRVVTLDARLRRGADRLGLVVAVHEL